MKKQKKLKSTSEDFKSQFKGAMNYLGESKKHIYAISLIFLSGIIMGFVFYSRLSFFDEILRELINQIEGLSAFGIMTFILQNNIKSSFFGLVSGVFLGILPVFSSFFNGLILGYVMNGVWNQSGISEFWRILPHGIFELPAVFISLALGLRMGMFIFSKEKVDDFLRRAKNSMIIFVCIVIPLLIIAAIIEGLLISFSK